MAHVLIGFAEALPAPEVVFSLLADGHRVSAFARDPDCPLRRLPLERLHVMPPVSGEWARTAPDWLRGIMDGPDAPDVVLPLDDAGLWLVSRALGEDPRVAGATGEAAAIALDKIRQVAAARAAGLDVPTTLVLHGPEDIPDDLPLPALLKPALALVAGPEGIDKGATRYIMSPADLASGRALLATATQPYLAQPLIHGGGEGIFGFATPEGVLAWSAHRRVRMMNPHGSGASACEAIVPDPDTCARIEVFLADIGWRGPFMMEFLRDAEDRLRFVELNGRMWGSMALARRQGCDHPAWAVRAALDPQFRPSVGPQTPMRGPVRHIGRELLHLLFVLRGPKTAFHRAAWPSFRKSLAGVLKPAPLRQFYNHDPSCPGYLWADTLWTLRKALRR